VDDFGADSAVDLRAACSADAFALGDFVLPEDGAFCAPAEVGAFCAPDDVAAFCVPDDVGAFRVPEEVGAFRAPADVFAFFVAFAPPTVFFSAIVSPWRLM
jgi:hypothetical protein